MKLGLLRMSLVLGISALIAVVVLFGGSSLLFRKVDDMVSSYFPPLSHRDAKDAAVKQSTDQLAKITEPGLLLNVPLQTLQEALAEALRQLPVGDIRVLSATVAPDEQGLGVTAVVEGAIAEPKGTFRATLKGWSVVKIAGQTASVRPVLESAELTDLSMDSWWAPDELIAEAINVLLRRYIENANGKITPLEYAIKQSDTGLPNEPVKIKLQDGTFVTTPAVQLGLTAVLVDPDGLHLLSQIDFRGDTPSPVATLSNATYQAYKVSFWQKAASVRSEFPQAQPGMYLSNSLLDRLFLPSFKPVHMKDLEKVALTQAEFTLRVFGDVAAGAVISARTLTEAIHAGLKENLKNTEETTFGEPALQLGEQSIMLTLPVNGLIKGSNLRYDGVIQGGGVLGFKDDKLTYRLVLGGINLKHVEHVKGPITVAPFISSVNDLVAQLLPFINAAMVQRPIELDLPELKPIPTSSKSVEVEPADLVLTKPGPLILIPRLNRSGLKVLVIEATELPASLYRYDLTLPYAMQETEPNTTGSDITSARASSSWFGVLSPVYMFNQVLKDLQKAIPIPIPPSGSPSIVERKEITPADVEDTFRKRWDSSLPPYETLGADSPQIQGAVSIRWVFSMVNRTLKSNNLSIREEFNSGQVPYDTGEIKLANDLKASCVTNVTCERGDCPLDNNCSRDACDYRCRRCVWTPWGDKCADEPVCKTSEVACNFREEAKRGQCNIAAETRRGLCNTEQETKLAACNVRREAERFGCNIVNEAIAAINKLNSIGVVTGGAQLQAKASITQPSLSYEPATGTMGLSLIPAVHLDAKGDVHFQPYDIGHILVCVMPGKVPFSFSGDLLGQQTNIVAHLAEGKAKDAGNLGLSISFDPVPITGQLSPAPLEALLVQNPQIFVTCNPVLTGALGSAVMLGKVSAFGPADILGAIEKAIPGNQEDGFKVLSAITSGKIDYKMQPEPMSLDVPSFKANVLGKLIELKPRWKAGQIMLEM